MCKEIHNTMSADDTQQVALKSIEEVKMEAKKRVSFELARTRYFEGNRFLASMTREELTSTFWYTESDLRESREDARLCLEALHAADGELDKVDSVQFCLRGIEKFANVSAKIQAQKLHMSSILNQQQRRKRKSKDDSPEELHLHEQLAALSSYLTQPSRELAHRLASWTADELSSDLESQAVVEEASSTTHGKHEHDAARALLCMSPASTPKSVYGPNDGAGTTSHPASFPLLVSSSRCLGVDEMPPAKRPRTLLTEETTLPRQVTE